MAVNNKRYEASFFQKSKESIDALDTTMIVDYFYQKALELYSEEELHNLTEQQEYELKMKLALQYTIELLEKKSVWFMIDGSYGNYRICMF